MANVRKQVREEGTRSRVPLGGMSQKLQMSEVDMKEFARRKMKTRWVNDRDGRLHQALAGGYSYVNPKYAESLGASAVQKGGDNIDSRVGRVVTKGGDEVIWAYLMEIPEKLWQQDQDAKMAKLVEQEKGQVQGGGTVDNPYGEGLTFTRP